MVVVIVWLRKLAVLLKRNLSNERLAFLFLASAGISERPSPGRSLLLRGFIIKENGHSLVLL